MKKAIIIGCPGSGKSTFARALSEITSLPLHYLDMMKWNADKTIVSREVFLERLDNALSGDEWIIDGNYGSTMERRLLACDTVFFLDYPLDVCLDGVNCRKGKKRPDMPWVEEEKDEEFISFIKSFGDKSRPCIYELLGKHPEKNIIIFRTRAESDEYLENLKKNI